MESAGSCESVELGRGEAERIVVRRRLTKSAARAIPEKRNEMEESSSRIDVVAASTGSPACL